MPIVPVHAKRPDGGPDAASGSGERAVMRSLEYPCVSRSVSGDSSPSLLQPLLRRLRSSEQGHESDLPRGGSAVQRLVEEGRWGEPTTFVFRFVRYDGLGVAGQTLADFI